MIDPTLRAETLDLLEWSRLCEHLSTFAATKIGSIACRHLDPWRSRSETEILLDQTQEAIQLDRTQPGGLSLQGIADLLPYLQRVEKGGWLQGEELLEIASTLGSARRVRRLLDAQDLMPRLQALCSTLRTYPELEQEISRCLEEDGQLRDSASETLQQLRDHLRQQRSQIQERLQRLLSERSSAIQDAVITLREGRYVLPVKASHKEVIRGLVHDSSASGATLYIEPHSVVEANNRLRQLQAKTRAEEERMLQALSQQVAAVAPDLEHLQAIITQLDLALARARYSLWLEGNRPRFVTAGLGIRQVRHPLLLWQRRHEEQSPVIPIDFRLNPQIRVVVITGPNTGGKTVALKTLGLMVLMAKVGLYLPARDPIDLPWFDVVYADIGDEQSLQQNLSTFSGHIRRIGRILKSLEESCPDPGCEDPAASLPPPLPILVLLDEVGAGTDPTEGAALAASLLESLGEQTLLTFATTHYGELKALKYQYSHFENASVEFNEATLAPAYRLLWGIPGRSNALTIAQQLELSPSVLERARARLEGSVAPVDAVIVGLEQQRAELEHKTHQVEALHQELEALQQAMQSRNRVLTQREAELQTEKITAVQAAIQSARAEVATVIRRLQQGDASGQAAQLASQSLDKIKQRYQPDPVPVETEFYPQVGDRVRLQGLGQIGEVIETVGDEFVVRSGILKFTTALNQLAPLDEHQAKQRQRPKFVPPPPTPLPAIRTSQNTLDLRGKRVADAEQLIEQAIAATAAGSLWIIHGHGTGKLRAGVQAFLQHHPRVHRLTPADPQDGGSGVTVAHLT